jgi:hypothetical protein
VFRLTAEMHTVSLHSLVCAPQPHSFVAVGLVILSVAISDVLVRLVRSQSMGRGGSKDGKTLPALSLSKLTVEDWASVWCWVAYGVVALGLGAPQLSVFMGRVTGSGHFVRIAALWHYMGGTPITLWFQGLGLFVPLHFAALYVLVPFKNFAATAFYVGFTVVFFVANVVMFQPWEMDNTKVSVSSVWPCTAQRRLPLLLIPTHRPERWQRGHRCFTFGCSVARRLSRSCCTSSQ